MIDGERIGARSFHPGPFDARSNSSHHIDGTELRAIWSDLVFWGLILAIGVLVGACGLYLCRAAFVDHLESSVLIIGWQYLCGMPIYGFENGLPHFASFYGPLAYLIPSASMAVFGPRVTSAKLIFALAPVIATIVLALHVRRRGWASARASLLILTSGLLSFGTAAWWLRPDPIELLLVAIAVALGPTGLGPVGVGICLGLVVNLKIHAFLYVGPVLFDILQRRGWRHVAVAVAISGGVFFAPFLLPGVSLVDYLAGLAQQVGGRSPDPSFAVPWLYWSVLLAAPLLAGLATAGRSVSPYDRRYAWVIIGVLLILGYPATIPGAGAYHLMPLIPVVADAFGRLRPRHVMPVLSLHVLLVVGVMATAQALTVVVALGGEYTAAQDAVRLANEYPGETVQVGYGGGLPKYKRSQLSRALLSLDGRPALIDGQLLMELDAMGIDGSLRWVPLARDCEVAVWLLPHDEEPFTIGSYYRPTQVFDDAFRAAFHARYRLVRTGMNYDTWRCDGTPHEPAG